MAGYINANELKIGNVYMEDGQALIVLKYTHIKKARAQAVIRVKVKDLIKDSVNEKTYTSTTKLEIADVGKKSAQYMYNDGNNAYFMDNETFDQIEFPTDQLEDQIDLLKEGQKIIISYLDGKAVGVELPASVELEVVESPDVNIGGTVTNPGKTVTLETGKQLDVPVFIKKGDIIRINTETATYVTRV